MPKPPMYKDNIPLYMCQKLMSNYNNSVQWFFFLFFFFLGEHYIHILHCNGWNHKNLPHKSGKPKADYCYKKIPILLYLIMNVKNNNALMPPHQFSTPAFFFQWKESTWVSTK
jgi:hypothetical protein